MRGVDAFDEMEELPPRPTGPPSMVMQMARRKVEKPVQRLMTRPPSHLDALDDFDGLEVTHVEDPNNMTHHRINVPQYGAGGGSGGGGGGKAASSMDREMKNDREQEREMREQQEMQARAQAARQQQQQQQQQLQARPRPPPKRQNTRSGPHVVVPPDITPDSQDVTPPQLMAMACEQLDWWRIMTLARQYGPAVTQVHAGEERLTPLHHAALNNKKDYAKDLALRCAAPTNAVDVYGDTPLIAAVQNCHHAIVNMLVNDAEADPTIVGRFGLTALHWCSEMEAEMEAAACAELLIAHAADPTVEDEAGKTPLHWAALAGKKQLCSLLLLRGGNVVVDSRDAAGRTPLFVAADKGRHQIVDLLLKRGASPTITDVNGTTAYEAARRASHAPAAKLLKKYKTASHSGPVVPVAAREEVRAQRSENIVGARGSTTEESLAGFGSDGMMQMLPLGSGGPMAGDGSSWDDKSSAHGSTRSKRTDKTSSARYTSSDRAPTSSTKKSSKCSIQ